MTKNKIDSLAEIPVSSLKGVGTKVCESLHQLKIFSVLDLLFHLPSRYEDRTRVTSIAEVVVGNKVLIEGEIITGKIQFGKRRTLLCKLQDKTGVIALRFFHFNVDQQAKLTTPGLRLGCFGEVRMGFRNHLEMVHPQYRVIRAENEIELESTLTPIYPTTARLQQTLLKKLINTAISLLKQCDFSDELLPPHLLKEQSDYTLSDALRVIHRPPPGFTIDLLSAGKHPAQKRLIFEELVANQLGLSVYRAEFRKRIAPSLAHKHTLQQKFQQSLPFALTGAQKRVIQDVDNDLAKHHPMLRLVQGDVGSGKTIVAAMALLQAVEHGMQAVLMAPTEILAQQHFYSLRQWVEPLGVKVGILNGSQKESERKAVLTQLKTKEVNLLVGTHALFQNKVEFSNLGLLVVDEQHRFGVEQRLLLKEKGVDQDYCPHQLIMTATPIPRTLAMSIYADLDISIIDEMPPGRKPITTTLISNKRRFELINRVHANCQAGRQAYWVCTIIEDSETLRAEAAAALKETLTKALPDLHIGLVHGRLKQEEKESIMAKFKQGDIQLLVATTVIEVGVDIPNATLMIIENAERLGLAQLHQLRGRVGRGKESSYCVLMYQAPLSEIAKKRLNVLRRSQSGFEVADEDLKIRGPGDLLGTKQTGLLKLKVADIMRDQYLLPKVNEACEYLIKQEQRLIRPLLSRWLGGRQQYAQV